MPKLTMSRPKQLDIIDALPSRLSLLSIRQLLRLLLCHTRPIEARTYDFQGQRQDQKVGIDAKA